MRRIALLVLVLPLMMSTGAGAQPTVSVRGNVGAAFFQAPRGLNSVLNSGTDLGLGVGIQIYRGLEVELQGGYDQFTLNEDNVALFSGDLEVGPSSSVDGGDYDYLSASIGLRYVYRNRSSAHPYLSSGVGIYRSTIGETKIYQGGELVQAASGRSLVSTGFHLAMGINFRIDDTYSVFFEPRYVVVNTEDEEFGIGRSSRYVPVRLGFDVRL